MRQNNKSKKTSEFEGAKIAILAMLDDVNTASESIERIRAQTYALAKRCGIPVPAE